MAWHFDETNDYVTMADDATLTLPDSDWAISGWVKLDDNTGSFFQYFLSWNTVSSASNINVFINEASEPGAANDISIVTRDAESDLINTVSASNPFLSNTAWTHVLVQRVTNTVYIYVDNVLAASATNTGYDVVNPATTWYFGAREDLDANRYFGGDLAEFAKWDTSFDRDWETRTLST